MLSQFKVESLYRQYLSKFIILGKRIEINQSDDIERLDVLSQQIARLEARLPKRKRIEIGTDTLKRLKWNWAFFITRRQTK